MQQEPNMTQSPVPQEKRSIKGMVVATVIIFLVGFPIVYSIGRSDGYNAGYNVGYMKGYDIGNTDGWIEGFDDGWEFGKFDFYYVKPEQKYGVYDLADWLEKWEWIKPYEEGVFDCSEMSAYLERKLENEGWHTKIVIGDSPSGSGLHAWLLVETSNGKYMPVESTTMSVVWWEDPYFDNYFEYDYSFETIQDALEYNETEFDWWES